MASKQMTKIGLLAAALLLVALFLSLSYSRPFLDEGIYLTAGWLSNLGKIPYNDFFLMKPAGIVFALSSWFSIFGHSLFSARLLALVVSLAAMAGVFLLGKKMFGTNAGLFSAFFFALWLVPFSGYFAIIDLFLALTAVFSALMLWLCFKEGKKWQIFSFGLFLCLSLLFKQTMVVFAVGSMAIALLIHPKAKPRKAGNFLLFGVGFLLPLLSFLAYLLYFNALPAFLEAVLFPVAGDPIFVSVAVDERLLLPIAAFAFVPIAWIALSRNRLNAGKKAKEILLLSLFFIFALANTLPLLGCCIHLIPALPFASVLAGFVIAESFNRKEKGFMLVSGLLLAAAVFSTGFSQMYFSSPDFSFSAAESLCGYVKETTSADEKILVMPASPELYFLCQRQPASRYLYFFGEYSDEFQREAVAELALNKPAMVVYLAYDKEDLWHSPEKIDQFLQEAYEIAGEIKLEPALYRFYNYAVILRPKGI